MNNTPKCPYCGDKMILHILPHRYHATLTSAWYQCVTCDSASPRIELPISCAISKIEETTLAVALRRVEPKNRVLTLKEVVRSEVMWYEQRTMQGARVVILGYAQNEPGFTQLIDYLGDKFYRRDDAYNDFWRCWLRKPTPKEMEETPWEGDSRE